MIECQKIPSIVNTNIDLKSISSKDNSSFGTEDWMIMKPFYSENLEIYVKSRDVDLRSALDITQKLLNIVKDIHEMGVIHRNIQPENIGIQCSADNTDVEFMLLNFTSAWIDHDTECVNFDKMDPPRGNQFYRMPEFETLLSDVMSYDGIYESLRKPEIDTIGICAILFWLITSHKPREARDIDGILPHKRKDYEKLIRKKIEQVTGTFKKRQRSTIS